MFFRDGFFFEGIGIFLQGNVCKSKGLDILERQSQVGVIVVEGNKGIIARRIGFVDFFE